MGVPVPTMVYTTPGALSLKDKERLKAQWSNISNFRGVPVLEGGAGRWASARYQGPCTQCGAPDETGAHVCAYCRSPRAEVPTPEMIEVTTLDDPMRRYLPMQDESFRK